MKIKLLYSLITILIFAIVLIACEDSNLMDEQVSDDQEVYSELLNLQQENTKLINENAALQEKLAELESELESMQLDGNHIVIDKTIDLAILEVIFKHFEAIEEKDEKKYKETLLDPENTNSTWTWDLADGKDRTYTITKLSNSGIGSPAVDSHFEFQDPLTGDVIFMTPTFMLSETESGYKIYDID